MAQLDNDVVLVTGGSGFIGQHIIQHLLKNKTVLGIKEIRSIDLKPFKNFINDENNENLINAQIGDICHPDTIEKAFDGVDTVFHTAAMISIQYPINFDELYENNIKGTLNVVDLCVQKNIKRLIYTSCASVCLIPFKGHSTFGLIINQTESKALTPRFNAQMPKNFEKQFLLSAYSASKLRAEIIVLNSNGAQLSNGNDYLTTVAIRPPLTYGEGDNHFIPKVLSYLKSRDYVYPRISGPGGKQQLAYAGNIAWGHVCAYKTLKSNTKAIAGLPVFVTDDTPINDVSRFIQKIAVAGNEFRVRQSSWYLPHFLFYFLAVLLELSISLLKPFKNLQFMYSPRMLSSFTSSVMMFNRLRAEIHMDYVPKFDPDTALQNTVKWCLGKASNGHLPKDIHSSPTKQITNN